MAAKPLFSLSAVFLSDLSGKAGYILLSAAVLACIYVCIRYLPKGSFPSVRSKSAGHPPSPGFALIGIYLLFSLIILERMNGAFILFVRGAAAPETYYFYFAGGLAAALASWWMFVKKKFSLTVAYDIFLFAALIHFVYNIGLASGLISLRGPGMVFFGISDIIYVFLFTTASSLSAAYGRRVFMGFVLVFGIALLGGFGFSYYLFAVFPGIHQTVYALVSLSVLAISFLFAPLLRGLTRHTPLDNPPDPPANRVQEKTFFQKENGAGQSNLTAREAEIVGFYLKGYSNQQIAQCLHIAPSTVKVHSRNIYEKLKIKSRIELIFLFRGGLEEE